MRKIEFYDYETVRDVSIYKSIKEIKCDKCNGSGKIKCKKCNGKGYIKCRKCNGTGKLDWIEAIVGKHKSKQFKVNWPTSEQLYGHDINPIGMEKLSKQIADDIDKQILEGIINGTKTGTWGSIM